jgi:hypothetical protein
MTTMHARAFDLPGWPCPPRVRDVPACEGSWGMVDVINHSNRQLVALAQDELGFLWANGDIVPKFRLPNDHDLGSPGAVVCWTPEGLGLWVHPKSLAHLPSISRLDMDQDRWIPVAVALSELPPHITKEHS